MNIKICVEVYDIRMLLGDHIILFEMYSYRAVKTSAVLFEGQGRAKYHIDRHDFIFICVFSGL